MLTPQRKFFFPSPRPDSVLADRVAQREPRIAPILDFEKELLSTELLSRGNVGRTLVEPNSGRPWLRPRQPKQNHRSRVDWAWLHYHAALGRTWKQGVQALRIGRPVYPRPGEVSTFGERKSTGLVDDRPAWRSKSRDGTAHAPEPVIAAVIVALVAASIDAYFRVWSSGTFERLSSPPKTEVAVATCLLVG